MKRILIAALALALCACTTLGQLGTGSPLDAALNTAAGAADAIGAKPPAPLGSTVIDEQGVTLAWEGFKAALDGINALRRAGVIKDGSPRAVKLADAIDLTTAALTAASAAQRASNATSYRAALADAKAALLGVRDILKGS
jgi:hypothetical protein